MDVVDVSTEWILNISVILNATARDSKSRRSLVVVRSLSEFYIPCRFAFLFCTALQSLTHQWTKWVNGLNHSGDCNIEQNPSKFWKYPNIAHMYICS